MTLNKSQLIVVGVASLLVVLSGVFVPYEGLFFQPFSENASPLPLIKYFGYASLFSPPSENEVFKIFYPNQQYKRQYEEKMSYRIDSRVIASRVLIQMTTIVLAAFGLTLILGNMKR